MNTDPLYGHVCLSCGQVWALDDGYAKHSDATGKKCRDVSGSSSCPSPLGPVARRPWGPEGVIAELRYEARYDHGWMPPPPEQVEAFMAEGLARIAHVVGERKDTE